MDYETTKAGAAPALLAYLRNQTGVAVIQVAVAAPVLMAAVGAATDMALFSLKHSQLQAVADEAAIAAANELALGKTNESVLQAAANAFIQAAISDPRRNVSSEVHLNGDAISVSVKLSEAWTPFLAHFLGVSVTPIVSKATAAIAGSANICVLALHGDESKSLEVKPNATITANNCAIFVDSSASDSINIGDQAVVTSAQLCTVGGASNGGTADAPPTTDCPVVADPLGARSEPADAACDNTNLHVSSGSTILDPGTYCGGITIDGTADVTFQAGNYVVRDGAFEIKGSSKVKGENVGFFLKGAASTISFTGNAEISLSGSVEDEMAGLLFFEERSAPLGRDHRISSNKAHTLTGTLYLSRGNLRIDPGASVASKSAYTVIIAQNLRLGKGPDLTLNTNYGATNVPVPEGIRASTQVVLTE